MDRISFRIAWFYRFLQKKLLQQPSPTKAEGARRIKNEQIFIIYMNFILFFIFL
jgi:hypothetical protein